MKKFVSSLLVSLALVGALFTSPAATVTATAAYPQPVNTKVKITAPTSIKVGKSKKVKVAIAKASTAVSGKPTGKLVVTITAPGAKKKTVKYSTYKGTTKSIAIQKPKKVGTVKIVITFTPKKGTKWNKATLTRTIPVTK